MFNTGAGESMVTVAQFVSCQGASTEGDISCHNKNIRTINTIETPLTFFDRVLGARLARGRPWSLAGDDFHVLNIVTRDLRSLLTQFGFNLEENIICHEMNKEVANIVKL